MSSSKADPCPCCEERQLRAGAWQFLPAGLAPPGACEACVLPPAPPLTDDLPPFVWPRTTAAIDALASDVEYRMRQIFQDAVKCMRHSKRSTLCAEVRVEDA